MLGLRRPLLLLACATFVWATSEDSHASEDGASDQSANSCFRPELSQYRQLFQETFDHEEELGEGASIYINCMSFNANSELVSAVVSGNSSDGANTRVLDFSCRGRTVLAIESPRNFSTDEKQSCLMCATDAMEPDTCMTQCENTCERCYNNSNRIECARCVAFVDKAEDGTPVCITKCPTEKEPIPEDNNECECLAEITESAIEKVRDLMLGEEDEEIEREIEEVIEKESACQTSCAEGYRISEHGNRHICYACGIQFCTECHKAETEGGHDECEVCLPHTKLYHEEGECLYGLRLEILEVAEEQEEEVEEEEREKAQSRLELAIILPIVCVLVIVFFIIMSFIAHKRYPHIGETGEKRHRRKRISETLDEDLSDRGNVFKPRPTVRLR